MPQENRSTSQHHDAAIVHKRGLEQRSFAQSMIEVRRIHGKDVMRQVWEMAAVAFGTGGVAPAEYYASRLYDDRLSDGDRGEFAGAKAMRRIFKACNFEEDWLGLVWDKLALYAILKGFGFPVPETRFVYHRSRTLGPMPVANSPEAFASLLRQSRHYPLFFKPNGSYQSLGAAAAKRFDSKSDKLLMADDSCIEVSSFVGSVERYAENGYLAQSRLAPHPSLKPICGDNLSTVRALVMLTSDGPRLLKAAWKLPSQQNIADNYWRPGNMMAAINPETGKVTRLVSGFGVGLEEYTIEPATSRPVANLQVPDWSQVKELSLAATSALGHLRLIGWDIGVTDKGPVIVEANETPDFGLHQIAEGRGVLTEEFMSFVQYCKAEERRLRAERKRFGKEIIATDFAQLRAHSRLGKP